MGLTMIRYKEENELRARLSVRQVGGRITAFQKNASGGCFERAIEFINANPFSEICIIRKQNICILVTNCGFSNAKFHGVLNHGLPIRYSFFRFFVTPTPEPNRNKNIE